MEWQHNDIMQANVGKQTMLATSRATDNKVGVLCARFDVISEVGKE
jgi:hypothetical protein